MYPEFIVDNNLKINAVIIPYELWEKILEYFQDETEIHLKENPELLKIIENSEKDIENNNGLTIEEISKELNL